MILVQLVFVITHKRSLGQGNIFTSVCQEFCSQGGAWCRGECLVPGGAWSGGHQPPDMAAAAGGTHPPGMHSCCYICYWLIKS